MRRLVYLSAPTGPVSQEDLSAILDDARETNALFGVTGMLIYQDGMFFQCLEGPEDSVQRIFDKIGRSSKHAGVEVLLDEDATDRLFPDWAMSFTRLDDDASLHGYRSLMEVYDLTARARGDGAATLVREFLLGNASRAA